jgi:6-phosphogluconolactonase
LVTEKGRVDPEPEVHVVDDVSAVALDLFLEVSPATILLTGGGTPRPFYERLAELREYPWEEASFFFSDERCVPDTDPRSNFGMAHRALLSKVLEAERFPMDGSTCDADGYEAKLRERFGDRPWFDFAVYGLGPDGHTASLFPGRPEVEERDAWVVQVPDAGVEPFVPRLSLTIPVLSAASLGMFLVTGEGKREALRRLLSGDDIPAARVKPERLVVVADRAAAAGV